MTVAVDFREGDRIMYEIGDKVIYQGADKKAYKKHGVVKSIEDKDGKPQLTVELDGGETFTAPIDDWSREFSNACKNAKFKVGDRVKDKHGIRGIVVGIQADDAGPFGPPPSKYGAILRIKTDDGKTGYLEEANASLANACVSTNSVVRNAMAVAARNAVDLGRGIILKSKEAEEVQRLLKSKGYDAAKKYCQEKKEAIKAVDGHRGWYFLDAALDAGKWAGVYNSKRVVANAMAARNAGTVYDRDLDEVTNKLEKVVKGLRQILEKMRPLMAERNRLIYKGDSNIYLSTPEGDPKTVAKYKELIEEYGGLKMSMR